MPKQSTRGNKVPAGAPSDPRGANTTRDLLIQTTIPATPEPENFPPLPVPHTTPSRVAEVEDVVKPLPGLESEEGVTMKREFKEVAVWEHIRGG